MTDFAIDCAFERIALTREQVAADPALEALSIGVKDSDSRSASLHRKSRRSRAYDKVTDVLSTLRPKSTWTLSVTTYGFPSCINC